VPTPAFALDVVSEHLRVFGPGPEQLVFRSTSGQMVARDGLAHAWHLAVETAELPAGTSPHDLRHDDASVLIAGGEDIVTVAARLGHANATVTLQTYAHPMPDSETRTRNVVEAAWSECARGLSADFDDRASG
jgi:site-specific recombinase XerD